MNTSKTAIILAAGRGSRLKELSLENPKPMTVVSRETIIENLIQGLIGSGIQKIVLVVGYMAEKLQSHVAARFGKAVKFEFVNNTIFDKTNNIYSLWLAREFMTNGFFLFEADIYCDASLIQQLITGEQDNIMSIDRYTPKMDGTVVSIDGLNIVQKMHLKRDQQEGFDFTDKYKTINFYRIGSLFANNYFLPKLAEHIQGQDVGSYYERIIKEAIDEGIEFTGLIPLKSRWWEIDTKEDLELARLMFNR